MVRERSIDPGGRRIAWLDAGAGWPVVLLHAFPLDAAMWRPQLERVPEGWRFIAPHLAFGPSLDDHAIAVGELLDSLAIDEAVIAGLSMGGYLAFAMYRQSPARFSGLVLADTRAQADTTEGRAGRVRMRELLARDGPRAVADAMLPKLLSDAADPAVIAHVRATIEAGDPRTIDDVIVAIMNRPDSTATLPRIGCATLVVVGEHDTVTPPPDAEAMQRAIPRAVLTTIPKAGHLSNLEQPDLFSRALDDFLRAHL
jgi:3-oxoadipate enol-lactonase